MADSPVGISTDGRVWYVIYVKARHEKSVAADLASRKIESYLPLRKEMHKWSDRKKWVEVPLFSSYVFVKVSIAEFNRVYLAPGFVKFVSTNGKPSVIPDRQIEDIRRVVDYFANDVEVLEGTFSGREAEVTAGPLAGLKGEIIELVNGKTFVIRVEGLDKLLNVKVPVNSVRVMNPPPDLKSSVTSPSNVGADAERESES